MFDFNNYKMKKAYPGLCLGSCVDFQPAYEDCGVYVYMGKLYASKSGFVKHEGESQEKLSIEQHVEEAKGEAEQAETQKFIIPTLNSTVYGKVNKLEDRFIRVEILAIDD